MKMYIIKRFMIIIKVDTEIGNEIDNQNDVVLNYTLNLDKITTPTVVSDMIFWICNSVKIIFAAEKPKKRFI